MHSRHFLEMLRHPAILGQVQTMSLVYLAESTEAIEDFVTPHEVSALITSCCGMLKSSNPDELPLGPCMHACMTCSWSNKTSAH